MLPEVDWQGWRLPLRQDAHPQAHLQRAGRPEDIAQSVAFLCSDNASYITGTTLTSDGAYTVTV